MIVVAILGIIAAIAVPQYGIYTKKSKFTQVTTASAQAKVSLSACVQAHQALSECDTWAKIGVNPSTLTASPEIASAEIEQSPVRIVMTASESLNSTTYELIPTYDNARSTLIWTVGGSCLAVETRYC